VSEVLKAYDGSGAAWARGPSSLYDRLAMRIVEPHAERLRGAMVLDAGAGTGAVCRALSRAGAAPIALDASADMLAQVGDAAVLTIVGDICSIPMVTGGLDAAVSAFAVSHVATPERAIAEMGRVVKPAGCVIVAVFGASRPNTSKDVVDQVAAAYGFVPPAWYLELKTRTEPLSNTPESLHACAQTASLHDIDIEDVTLASGLDTPQAMVEYRIGMAHLSPFARSLTTETYQRFVTDAIAAVAARGQAVSPRVLILSSRASA
jgi:ubiquinone/menaquinone biosynthesis C-methylase UbiE